MFGGGVICSVGKISCYSTMRAWVQIPVTHVKPMCDQPNPQPPGLGVCAETTSGLDAIVSFNLRERSSLNCLKAIRWKMIQQDPRRTSSLGLCMCVHEHDHLHTAHTHIHTRRKEKKKMKSLKYLIFHLNTVTFSEHCCVMGFYLLLSIIRSYNKMTSNFSNYYSVLIQWPNFWPTT